MLQTVEELLETAFGQSGAVEEDMPKLGQQAAGVQPWLFCRPQWKGVFTHGILRLLVGVRASLGGVAGLTPNLT